MKTQSIIQSKKSELISMSTNLDDLTVLNKIDEWENQSIEIGLQEAEDCKLNDHSKAKQLYEKWL
ncbi:hypothetical protein HME7025_01131 [Aquirufa nivalisilvae]|uniref:Uncharacterized protein n=1 Tax=Aquirufa nivalisilvae TaxID=2516557 RepID=A0A2S2DUB0_9BACT|nr:hypothetical protein [Aquirufa nivalisilvae]AWL08994.1 hypothetical protein HME7025_01131 [Aquirufa nivalisilvae]